MDNFEEKKKRLVADLPDTNLHLKKMVLTKKIIQSMLNMFYILSAKSRFFFSGTGIDPPSLPSPNMSAKKSSSYDALPKVNSCFL